MPFLEVWKWIFTYYHTHTHTHTHTHCSFHVKATLVHCSYCREQGQEREDWFELYISEDAGLLWWPAEDKGLANDGLYKSYSIILNIKMFNASLSNFYWNNSSQFRTLCMVCRERGGIWGLKCLKSTDCGYKNRDYHFEYKQIVHCFVSVLGFTDTSYSTFLSRITDFQTSGCIWLKRITVTAWSHLFCFVYWTLSPVLENIFAIDAVYYFDNWTRSHDLRDLLIGVVKTRMNPTPVVIVIFSFCWPPSGTFGS